MAEHELASTLTEIPPIVPVINVDPMHQIILVQVNPGETLTLKSDDGNIQSIQGPADVPLMSPSGTLPPIYLPPGYMSQVVDENGIRKIIIVPQTIDYHTTMPAPIQKVPHFITPSSPMYLQGSQFMYPSAQGEFLPPYIQEPMPQELPPPATDIYHEQQETYSHGRANYNQFDERAAKMEEHMKKNLGECQVGRQKNNDMVNNTSLHVNKTNDFSSIPPTPSTYTVDYAPSTYTVDNTLSTHTVDNATQTYTDSTSSTYTVDNTSSTFTVENVPCTYTVENTLSTYTVDNGPSTYTVNNAQNIYTADSTPSTYIVDSPPSTNIANSTPGNSSTDHVPSTPTTDSALSSTIDSVPNSSSSSYVPKIYTSDSTPKPLPIDSTPSPSISDHARSTPISESAPSPSIPESAPSPSIPESVPSTPISESAPSTPIPESVPRPSISESVPSTPISENVPSTPIPESAPSPSISESVPSTPIPESVPSTPISESAPSPSISESVPSTPIPESVPSTPIPESAPSPSISESVPSTPIPESVPSTPISESAPSTSAIDGDPSASNAASNSNTVSAHVETSPGKKWNATRSRDIKQKPGGKQNKLSSSAAEKECIIKHGKSCCFTIEKPIVSDIQTRSAVISWKLHGSKKCDHTKSPVTFELAISNSGKNGNYKNLGRLSSLYQFTAYDFCSQACYLPAEWLFLQASEHPLQNPAFVITTIRGSAHKTVSEVVSFTTPGCKPDPPPAPKLINRSKSSLNLQWKGSNDNGSKINGFLLEWDEGKGEDFKSCYMGTMKQYKILKLNASTKYSFRLAAKNNFGLSDFSEIAVFHTSGTMPPTPLPPKLKEAGICTLSLEWCAPSNTTPNDSLTYVLEMEEAGSELGFKPKYNGEDLSCTVRNLQRSTTYKFRIFAYTLEGRSNPSGEVKYTTCPDKPGSPKKPYIKGKIYAHKVKIGWEPPQDNGGTYISSYSLEVSENSDVNSWNIIYNGTTKEFLYDHLKPGTTYKLRVFCTSPIGQSQPSDILTIETPTLSPASCHPPPLNGEAITRDTNIKCENPPTNGNSEAFANVTKEEGNQNDKRRHPGSKVRCTSGAHSKKCETAPVPSPPSQCGTPVVTCKGPTCVVVSWEIPVCNGAEITDYRLEWGQAEESMHLIYTGSCLSYELKGLIPATTYFCRVQAVNVAGVGLFGGTGRVTTPATVPAVVPMLYEVENKVPAKLASSCIAIKWEEPDCRGSPITGYNIEYGDRKILTVQRVTECLLKNLQPDTTYKIRIQAINHYGLSPFSQLIRTKTKPLPLDPPHLDCVVYGHQSLKLKWGNSSSKGLLSNLISYNLLIEDRSGRFSIIYHGPCQTHKVNRLSEYTQYKFKIQTCSEADEGPLSGIYTFTTAKTPPATLKAPKLQHVNSNTCEVKWESLEPIKGDPIVYNLQLITDKGTDLIYKGPNTSFSFSKFVTNSHYRFKVCAGRQYQTSAGIQELWGPYSPSTLFSPHKQHPGPGKGGGRKGRNSPSEEKKVKPRIEISDDTFILFLVMGFALVAILCAVVIQYFIIN
ncbi:fibronectin type III domain containing protein 3C1-like [Suricata suricatta]|uniref:fibronectin type III domain containing protein 3C1-like n=1 Tax=Suricata suricatta TaxID=37032 RepID=UPI001155F169|nr:fibronectin type III domain containing protein 3C1-like [Suricata suricatta]